MSALVVDSSSWISYFRGGEHSEIDEALVDGRVYLPPVVLAELCSGELRKADREALLDFLADLPLCSADRGHWIRVGELRRSMRARGLTVSTPDAHVAQCAIDLNADLLTEDAIFTSMSQHCELRLIGETAA